MKIIEGYPPNIDVIKLKFPSLDDHKPIFSYGDSIFNPFKVVLTPDLEFHEKIHSERQGEFPEIWWNRYLTDDQFRLEEELLAYSEQFKFFKERVVNPKLTDWLLDKISMALSGELYGNLISYGEARSKIRNYAKNML